MNPLSVWAPNLHPLLVHFPIGLLVTAVGVDAAGCVFGCNRWLREQATLLYVIGTLMTIATYFTGRAAAQTIWIPGMAQAVVKDHWDWAFRSVLFFGMLTVVRLVVLRGTRRTPRPVVVAVLTAAGLVGVLLLGETGDRGGRLVYLFGVGTTTSTGP